LKLKRQGRGENILILWREKEGDTKRGKGEALSDSLGAERERARVFREGRGRGRTSTAHTKKKSGTGGRTLNPRNTKKKF